MKRDRLRRQAAKIWRLHLPLPVAVQIGTQIVHRDEEHVGPTRGWCPKPDGSRSINVRFNHSPLGSSMFFHREQWQVFAGQLGRAKGAPEGTEQKFPDLPTPGGSLLRMSFVRHGGEISLTLTLINLPDKGDSYPPGPFHLAPTDFDHLLKAMVEAAKAEIIVSAASAAEFARFRADLGTRFTPEQLQDFDTAIQELQIDAMNRGKATAADREADMLAVVNRKTFPDAVLLGWRARRVRILREFPEARRLVDQDTAEAVPVASAASRLRVHAEPKNSPAEIT